MSNGHGDFLSSQSVGEIAQFIKNLVPVSIPADYALRPCFDHVAAEADIRDGVVSYRDFLLRFFDRLMYDGQDYFSVPSKPRSAGDYPFLLTIADLLSDIGYYGIQDGDALRINQLPSFVAIPVKSKSTGKPKNSSSKLLLCMRFLALCGFAFIGIDVTMNRLPTAELPPISVTYPKAPLLLIGLKALSIADRDLRIKRYKNDNNRDNLLRCDYHLLKAEGSDNIEIVKNFVHPLPEHVSEFALELHQRHVDLGMTCTAIMSPFEAHIAYAQRKNTGQNLSSRDVYKRRMWEFSLSTRHGYCLVVRPKKADTYGDLIETFPPALRERIIRGYGCDRTLRDEPCQVGCQGIRLALDDSILERSHYINKWLAKEYACQR